MQLQTKFEQRCQITMKKNFRKKNDKNGETFLEHELERKESLRQNVSHLET